MPRIYIPNPLFFAQLKAQREHQEGMAELGEQLADAARDVAPERTGAYKDSISVAQSGGRTAVLTTDFAGHIVEFGSRNNPAFAPLRSGARKAGFRLEEH